MAAVEHTQDVVNVAYFLKKTLVAMVTTTNHELNGCKHHCGGAGRTC